MKTYPLTRLFLFFLAGTCVLPPSFSSQLLGADDALSLVLESALSYKRSDSLTKKFGKAFKAWAKWAAEQELEEYLRRRWAPPAPPPSGKYSDANDTQPPPEGRQAYLNYLVKKYLYKYGYTNQETKSAIMSYQRFFNLPEITGELDKDTVEQMMVPRCGVPDRNITYNLTHSGVSWPPADKTKWYSNQSLTYSFHPRNQLPRAAKKPFVDSFHRWSAATQGELSFTETTSFADADIKVGFYTFDHSKEGVDWPVASTVMLQRRTEGGGGGGGGGTFAFLILDDSYNWTTVFPAHRNLSLEDGEVDLESVAMHQIGHLLGLPHSSDKDSVMYPYLLPTQKVELTDHDREQARLAHSSSDDSVVPSESGGLVLGSRSALLSALSLGFLCAVL